VSELREVASHGRSDDELQVLTRPVGEDDGEPSTRTEEMGEESRRLDTLMKTDPRLIADPLDAPIPVDGYLRLTDDSGRALRDIEAGERGEFVVVPGPQPSRNILAGRPVTASAPVPAPIVSNERQTCQHCEGTGYMPSVSDLLRESAEWISDMDSVVKAFYEHLLDLAHGDAVMAAKMKGATDEQAGRAGDEAVADLAYIFPADLLTARAGQEGSRGAAQRDKLAKALVALATMYDPSDADAMARLDTALTSMGARHASFARRDGTVSGATLAEYNLVKRALMDILSAGLGPKLTAAHAAAWSQAYDDAAGTMLRVAARQTSTAPRFPRA
jgi:hemoglobin-like flavoprotein